MMATRFFI